MSLLDTALGFVSPPLAIAKKLAGKVPAKVWLGLAVVAAVLFYGHLRYNAGQADVQAKFDAYRGQVIGATAIAAQHARAKEASDRARFAAVSTTHAKELADAIAQGNATADAIRRGALRLRDHWTCPAGLPEAAAGPGGRDEAADLRAADIGHLRALGASADADIRACQALLTAERAP